MGQRAICKQLTPHVDAASQAIVEYERLLQEYTLASTSFDVSEMTRRTDRAQKTVEQKIEKIQKQMYGALCEWRLPNSFPEFRKKAREFEMVLLGAGITNMSRENGRSFYLDENETPHYFPTEEQIVERVVKHFDQLILAGEQHFTEMLVVPFGMKLETLASIVTDKAQALADNGQLSHEQTYDKKNRLRPRRRIDHITDPEIVPLISQQERLYYRLNADGERVGKTKAEWLAEDPNNGWEIIFIRSGSMTPSMERPGRGELTTDLHHTFTESGPKHESFMTAEQWLIAFLLKLRRDEEVLDENQPSKETDNSCAFLGSTVQKKDTPTQEPLFAFGRWNEDIGRIEIGMVPASTTMHTRKLVAI
jgi:hypothetical protein